MGTAAMLVEKVESLLTQWLKVLEEPFLLAAFIPNFSSPLLGIWGSKPHKTMLRFPHEIHFIWLLTDVLWVIAMLMTQSLACKEVSCPKLS